MGSLSAAESPASRRSRRSKAPATPKIAKKAPADLTQADRLADLDGFTPSPLLNYEPAGPGHQAGKVCRWETEKRYYEARIELDMFETPILLAANGGKGTRLGMMRVVAAGQQIEEALQAIERRREAHGYVRVT
jgi:hypothetical protein